jgi:predicted O-linked N-acetylglucosamine transferase (SPINDLY family)
MPSATLEQALQLAIGYHQAGRFPEAEEIYRQILVSFPDHAGTLHWLGATACVWGHFDVAIDLISRAIAINPAIADYHGNLGEAYRRSMQLEKALVCFRRTLELAPDHGAAHNNLGIALKDIGSLDEAITSYGRAIQLDPAFAEAHCNLGVALHEKGRTDEAIASYRRAIELKPDLAAAHNNLGNALADRGCLDEAVDAYRRVVALGPDLAAAHNNLGNVLRQQGCIDEALACYRKAVEIRPDYVEAASNLELALYYHPAYDAQAILAEHRDFARRFAAPLASQIRPHTNDRTPDRKLRIGFVSADLRSHAVGYLLAPWFPHHDRRDMDFVCYSDVKEADETTRYLQSVADGWYSTVGLGDAEVADRIRNDGIDILVDLAVHTARNRLLVFARKPAPVQMTMLGMPGTTGLDTIDYRLTDPYLDPIGTDGDYTERSIRLPHCFWIFRPPEGAPAVGALPAARNGFVTFGCLNQFAKVSRPALELWIKILQLLPRSRLVLQLAPGRALDAVRTLFEEGGICADRVVFADKTGRVEYLHRYQTLDIGLDPFPYNGHTSTLEALWMGVPVVTLAGRTAVGRGGLSILSNVDLPGLIARTPEEYVAIALDWAREPARLAALRDGLRQRMLASPLMDGKQYAADVEAAFGQMWRKWCGT